MIYFLIGIFIGSIGGFFLAAILAASRGSRMDEVIYRGRHKKED